MVQKSTMTEDIPWRRQQDFPVRFLPLVVGLYWIRLLVNVGGDGLTSTSQFERMNDRGESIGGPRNTTALIGASTLRAPVEDSLQRLWFGARMPAFYPDPPVNPPFNQEFRLWRIDKLGTAREKDWLLPDPRNTSTGTLIAPFGNFPGFGTDASEDVWVSNVSGAKKLDQSSAAGTVLETVAWPEALYGWPNTGTVEFRGMAAGYTGLLLLAFDTGTQKFRFWHRAWATPAAPSPVWVLKAEIVRNTTSATGLSGPIGPVNAANRDAEGRWFGIDGSTTAHPCGRGWTFSLTEGLEWFLHPAYNIESGAPIGPRYVWLDIGGTGYARYDRDEDDPLEVFDLTKSITGETTAQVASPMSVFRRG